MRCWIRLRAGTAVITTCGSERLRRHGGRGLTADWIILPAPNVTNARQDKLESARGSSACSVYFPGKVATSNSTEWLT